MSSNFNRRKNSQPHGMIRLTTKAILSSLSDDRTSVSVKGLVRNRAGKK